MLKLGSSWAFSANSTGNDTLFTTRMVETTRTVIIKDYFLKISKTAILADPSGFALQIYTSQRHADIPNTSRKEGWRIKPLGGYAAEMGLPAFMVKFRLHCIMGQNPKFLVCRSCGHKPNFKRVRRRCPLCGSQMRVDREK